MDTSQLVLQISEWLGVVAVGMLAGLSPAVRQRRPLVFRFSRREVTLSLALFGGLLIVAFIVYGADVPHFSLNPASTPRLLLAGGGALAYLAALLGRGQPLRSAGWERSSLRSTLLLGLGLGLLVLFLHGKVFSLMRGVTSQQGVALLALLLICIAEESVFRGYIQMRLISALGRWQGIVLTAVLFALWQLPYRLALGQALPLLLGLALVQGLVLGYIADRGGGPLASGLYRAVSEWIGVLG